MPSSTTEWLTGRPKWLQVAAKRLLESGDLDDTAISDLADLCLREASSEFPDIDCSIPSEAFDVHDSEEIRLRSISEITGVNRLAPKRPLDFGDSNIVIVYGGNGSGKSGYVRLLKHICGARDSIRGRLHKDVFSTENIVQKAKVSFLKNNALSEYEWTGSGGCDDLRSVDIFDTSFGQVFIGSEDVVRYEPPILSFFSKLISICGRVASKLDTNAGALRSTMPEIPDSYLGSIGAAWIRSLSAQTPADEVELHCSFTQENETELQDLQRRLSETSPADKANQLRTKKRHADSLINDVQAYLNKLSDESCEKIIEAKEAYSLKKSAADTAAANVFSGAKLEGVGSEIWQELWNAARKYSEGIAYGGMEFPHLQNDSVCVLCHQPLSEEAKQRFISFESYIKGETQKQADAAAREVRQALDTLPDIPSLDTIKTKMDAAGIENQDIAKALNDTFTTLQDRKSKVSSLDSDEALGNLSQSPEWIGEIHEISKGYEDSATRYEEDAASDNHTELQGKLKNLQTKKWLSEQKTAIQDEINRLRVLDQIQEAKKKTNSTALSKKKGDLAEILITNAFVRRFNNELKALRANKLKVKLVKVRVSRGAVLHTLQLDGATTHDPNEILSEGESRIVSIAAFLADVTGKTHPAPFVFDDPISSLDEDYEEAVVQHLCSIAHNRQVIIFTHRLSLLGTIEDQAKKDGIEPEIICIRDQPWGTGEPGDIPFSIKKPAGALNQLINERLPKARKALNEYGRDDYELYHAKTLCSDFRILLERMIEYELMGDVVQRYRREITTKGKISNLAKASKADCEYFDKLMSKYSKYAHSQPVQAPVPLPEPDELETDFSELKEWLKEFRERELTPAQQEIP